MPKVVEFDVLVGDEPPTEGPAGSKGFVRFEIESDFNIGSEILGAQEETREIGKTAPSVVSVLPVLDPHLGTGMIVIPRIRNKLPRRTRDNKFFDPWGFTPPMNDPSWVERSKGLLDFLSVVRTWNELVEWCVKDAEVRHSMYLRQLLAWLSVNNRIEALGEGSWGPSTRVPDTKKREAIYMSAIDSRSATLWFGKGGSN